MPKERPARRSWGRHRHPHRHRHRHTFAQNATGGTRWESTLRPDGENLCLPLGVTISVALVSAFCAEIASLYLIAPVTSMGPRKTSEAFIRRGGDYSNRALTLAGLTLATIGLVYTSSSGSIAAVSDILPILALALVFFLCSYTVSPLIFQNSIFWIVQDKTMAFGVFSMVAGLLVLAYDRLPFMALVLVLGLAVLSLFHVWEYRGDFKVWKANELAWQETR